MAEAHREEIAKLEALYAAHPEGRVFTHLAEAYRRAGELERAREILEDGLRRHPDYSSAHVVYGRVQMDRGETDGAAAAFRRVLELDRHNLVALRALGDLSVQAGDRAAAIGYYRDLIALDPTDDRLRLAVTRLEEELATGAPESEPETAAPGPVAAHGEEPPRPVEVVDEAAEAIEAASFEEAFAAAAEAVEEPAAEAEPDLAFPTLEEGEGSDDPFAYEEAVTLEVEGLTLDYEGEASAAVSDAEPADETVEAEGDEVPDAFAGMGWMAGDTAEDVEEEETGPEAADVFEDTVWASLGERAEASWEAGEEEAAAGSSVEDVVEVHTWGPLPDEPEAELEVVEAGTEADAIESGAGAYAPAAEEAPTGAPPSEVVTATMAELYAQQGFYDRSVDVYRQLLAQVPEDARLKERLTELEALSRAGPDLPQVAEELEAEDLEESASEAASVWTGGGGVAGGEETPYAWSDSTPAEEGRASGATAGEYFRALLDWRPGGGAADSAPAESDDDVELEAGAVEAAFEEWFGDEPADGEPESSDDAGDEEDADLAMFRSWLQSLKQ